MRFAARILPDDSFDTPKVQIPLVVGMRFVRQPQYKRFRQLTDTWIEEYATANLQRRQKKVGGDTGKEKQK